MAAMKQIRIRWSIEGRSDVRGHSLHVTRWMESTASARANLDAMAHAACEIHGQGTHWVEVRDSCESIFRPPILHARDLHAKVGFDKPS
ncbi:hypothetical protein EC845_0972 [Comamonas sp. BIGb0124]|nr:hypothetical protein EC845_0972 [Comamonas sp. BIGb0124]